MIARKPIDNVIKESVEPSLESDTGNKLLTLQDIAPSIIMDISANITKSYNGTGQTLSNIVASYGTDYDFWLGADGNSGTDEPTYSGTETTGKFVYDGVDDILVAKTARPAELLNLYNFSKESTWIWYGKMPADITGWQGLFNSTSNGNSMEGVWIYNAGGHVDFTLAGIDGPTSRSIRLSAALNAKLLASTEHLIMITVSNASNANIKKFRIYVDNMNIPKYDSSNFGLTNNTITSNASPIHIGSNNLGSGLYLKNGGEFYGAAIANSSLTQIERNDIKTELLARRGL